MNTFTYQIDNIFIKYGVFDYIKLYNNLNDTGGQQLKYQEFKILNN